MKLHIGRWLTALSAICASISAQVGPLEIQAVRPPSGSGYETTLRLTVSDGKDGSSVSSVGIYVGSDRPERAATGCLAYWDRNANAFFLGDSGAWKRTALRGGAAVENGRCRIVPAESRVVSDGDPVAVEVAVQFLPGFEGTKLVYAYANVFDHARDSGWKEVGTWRVLEEGVRPSAAAVAAAAGVTPDPNDLPTAVLTQPDTPYLAFLRANPSATALPHQQGKLLFQPAIGKRAAIIGPVTHQDQTTGAWIPNAPVLSATNNGWRVDGTLNSLLIKKPNISQHSVTQIYSDYTTRHDSTLTVTVPSLVYDGKTDFHYVQDGLTWKLGVQYTGAMNLVTSVAARRGPKTYTFDASSSETLSVDASGNLIGDGHVFMSRAVMVPKVGKRVSCSAWSYTKKDGASFTCDDSGLKDNQLPYQIDPQTQTFTNGGSYHVDSWAGDVWSCDDEGNNCGWGWQQGSDSAQVFFNTSGLIPAGGSLLSASCGFHSYNENLHEGDSVKCEIPNGFNNGGSTQVHVWAAPDWYDSCNCQSGYGDSADVDNISLTVIWTNGVTVTVSPATLTVPVNSSYCAYAYMLCATVDAPNPAATFSMSPNIGSLSDCGYQGDHCRFYASPAVVDGNTTITVTATAVADTSKTGTAIITIPGPSATVSISPNGATLRPLQQQQFSATVTNRVTQTVNWSLSPSVGTVTSGGLYTAPASVGAPQNITLTATSTVDASASASVTISLLPPILVTVTPGTASIGQGQTQQFAANVQYTGNTGVTWSRSPALGSMNSSGLYTAPSSVISSVQTVTITATSAADGVSIGTATLALTPVTVSVTPALSSMNPSRTNQMTPTVGNAANTAVTWSMVSGPGSISAYGVYTSPITVVSSQTVTVRATSVADGSKSATASFTVTPWGAGTPYQYYVTDAMTTINANYWGLNGSAAASSGGLTAGSSGGSAISRLAVADGSNDYEVEATVHVPSPVNGGVYAVLARASADANPGGITGSYYAFSMEQPVWDSYGCSAMLTVKVRTVTTGPMVLTQLPFTCHDGMKMRMIVRGSSITVGIDSGWTMTLTDTTLATGQAGFYIAPQSGATISSAMAGAIDAVAPGAVASPIAVSAMPSRVDLRWTASVDDNAGAGIAGYRISRDGVVLGTTAATTYTDETATPGTATTYSIVAFDWHGNTASATTKTVTPPTTPPDPRRIGVRPTGAYWGAAGEQIDVMSGNLNFALPLYHVKSRTGWGVTFLLSYSSQMWRQDAGGTWNLGQDVGYGYGWRLQAGSLFPVIYNGSILYLIFTDATGAEYRLDQDNGNMIFRSKQGLHLWMDWNSGYLCFPDGSKWYMGSVSSSLEPDAGTRYPNLMIDTNGNQVAIDYQAGAGSTYANTSARIVRISDSRGTPYHSFTYSGGSVPHLVSGGGPDETYTVSV